jgi:signal transduction histidine kinase
MTGFWRRRRGSGGLPSTTGLILLFVFTMALPAILLLLLSLEMARQDDLDFEIQMSRILIGRAQEFQAELDSTTLDWLKPYLEMDWSRWMNSSRELAGAVENGSGELFLFGLDGTPIFPLFPPSPEQATLSTDRSDTTGWRRAVDRARMLADEGDYGHAMEALEELRRYPLQPSQRAEALLEEVQILTRQGKKREAWERLDEIVRHYPQVQSSAGIPLALVAMELQIDLSEEARPNAIERLAKALYLGGYFPSVATENLFWDRLLTRRNQVPSVDWDRLVGWRKRREAQRSRTARLREEIPFLKSLVSDPEKHFLRIQPAPVFSSYPVEVSLIQFRNVEQASLLAIWDFDPRFLLTVAEEALSEILRFRPHDYLRLETPSGKEWTSRGPETDLTRSIPLETPWNGWRLTIGLEQAGQWREQAIRERREARGLVGIAAFVLLIGTVLVFRGVRRQVQVTKAKSDFVSAISHELRTPVANIRLYGEMLQMGVPATETEREEAHQAITSETERLSRLIEGVLNYSRIQQGKKVFQVEEADLRELVYEVVERVERSLDRPFQFQVSVAGIPGPVWVDPDAFCQALENLLSNAVKYSRDKQIAEIEIQYGPKRVEVSVQDYGIGISRRNRKKIFERFHRVEDELTRETSGTGLGLTLARDLVRGFGGEITVRSRLGEGSRFSIVIRRKGK